MRWQADWLSRSDRAALPARPQHRDGRYRLGSPATRASTRQNLDGGSSHGGRAAFLRPTQRRFHGRGSTHGQNPVALPDQRTNESFSHDLRVGWQAIHCRSCWPEHPLLRFVRKSLSLKGFSSLVCSENVIRLILSRNLLGQSTQSACSLSWKTAEMMRAINR